MILGALFPNFPFFLRSQALFLSPVGATLARPARALANPLSLAMLKANRSWLPVF